ncbi:MAG TPA: chloride channel protein [Steroidobacteraceae bacterium]|nr:chloride channel protein [Steroidobacteraceae bacterium]
MMFYNLLADEFTVRKLRRRFVFWAGAIAVGAGAVLFTAGSDLAMNLLSQLRKPFPWWPYVAAPLGISLCVWLTRTVFVGAEGSGIPQTMAALTLSMDEGRDRLLSLRIALGKVMLTVLALATGASVGREGPTVQVGASIMHSLRRYARFSSADIDRGLILAGGAAGVAAAFNTPLAGVVFAIEELSRSFEARTSGTIITAVVVAGVTSLAIVGNYTYFGTTSAVMTEPHTWVAVPFCAVISGLLGGCFSLVMIKFVDLLPAPVRKFRLERPVMFAAACGVGIALIGFVSSGTTFGTGYAEAKLLLQNEAEPAAGFALWKALATLLSYASGIPGGLFAPSLAVGAGIGAHLYSWAPLAPAGAMVVISMAAFFAGVVHAPLTALVIVTEMTGNRSLTLPLMAAALIGRGASAMVCRGSLYRELAKPFLKKATDAQAVDQQPAEQAT